MANLENDTTANPPEWRFFGRRAGRRIKGGRHEALADLYPRLKIEQHLITKDGTLDPRSLFDSPLEKIIFEIGFGGGERMAQHIQQEPSSGFIGAEPFANGMAAFLKQLDLQKTTSTVRVYQDDGIPLAKSLTSASLDCIMVLNPDPWHKTRHHKRRLINPDNLDIFARLLKPDGMLIMTTDVLDLIEWMVTHASNHPAFEWQARCADDWRNPPPDWIPTRYETKGAKGAAKMHYLFFKKKTLA